MPKFSNTYSTLPQILYSNDRPENVPEPKLALLNTNLIKELSINNILNISKEDLAQYLSGNKLFENSTPIAQAYAGHQFGYFTILGDGRAILLGEHITEKGERFDIQLKGSGKTAYSRRGDGKAVLGPMLREYVVSEAMHALNIPTTRSLAVVTTGEQIYRNGYLPGAILTRVAKSHIRVGTFEYVAIQNDFNLLKDITDYTINRHYPELNDENDKYSKFILAVIKKQAELIAKWQSVGFVHGVMNTDNMSIAGETIDYGPCAFLDGYNSEAVFSSIDRDGRYAYKNQPYVAKWNLSIFITSLLPLINENKKLAFEIGQKLIKNFDTYYKVAFIQEFSKKLGLSSSSLNNEFVILELLKIMESHSYDFTNSFFYLNKNLDSTESKKFNIPDKSNIKFTSWYALWQEKLKAQEMSQNEVDALMSSVNPCIIPRNKKLQEALDFAEQNLDLSKINEILELISNPYLFNDKHKDYQLAFEIDNNYTTYCGT